MININNYIKFINWSKTNNINIGTATLTTYLEDCTIKHLKKQMPRIHKVLQKVKGDTQKQLSKVREVFLPIDILNDTLNSIRKSKGEK